MCVIPKFWQMHYGNKPNAEVDRRLLTPQRSPRLSICVQVFTWLTLQVNEWMDLVTFICKILWLCTLRSIHNLIWGLTLQMEFGAQHHQHGVPPQLAVLPSHTLHFPGGALRLEQVSVASQGTEKWPSLTMFPILQKLLLQKHLFRICLGKDKQQPRPCGAQNGRKDLSLSKWHEDNLCRTRDAGRANKNGHASELDRELFILW